MELGTLSSITPRDPLAKPVLSETKNVKLETLSLRVGVVTPSVRGYIKISSELEAVAALSQFEFLVPVDKQGKKRSAAF